MRLLKIFILLLMGFISTNGFSQTKFTGTVISENDAPLSKATITLKGSNQSVTSDEAGHFTLNSDAKKGTLLISYVGYETEIVSIQANQTDFTVKLRVLQQQLNEAVVVGYGTQKKKDLTGSVSSVNSDHMNLGGTTSNIAQAIQGRAAGVQVQQSDFSPGGSIAITIRGGNSINTTNEPLYVVDGLISDNGKFINPNDIEDIQILKDASATAIYGARGGNGVVLITTKKGKAGKMLLEADASNGTQYLTYTPSLLNGTQYATIQNAIAAEDSKPPVFPSSFPIANTNWFKNTTQQASVLNRTISFSGNDKTSKLYLSGNYFKQDGVLKHTTLSVTQ